MKSIKTLLCALLAVVGLVCITGTVQKVNAADNNEFKAQLIKDDVGKLYRSGKQFYYEKSIGLFTKERIYVEKVMSSKDKAKVNKILKETHKKFVVIENGAILKSFAETEQGSLYLTLITVSLVIITILVMLSGRI